jgi:acyl-CoA hydrolase
MSDVQAGYREKLRSAREIVAGIKPASSLVFGTWYGQLHGMMQALASFGSAIAPLYVNVTNTNHSGEFLLRDGVYCSSGFLGWYERAARAKTDNLVFIPVQFTDGFEATKSWKPAPDYFIHRVAPMDERGYFNFSLTSSWEYRSLRWL